VPDGAAARHGQGRRAVLRRLTKLGSQARLFKQGTPGGGFDAFNATIGQTLSTWGSPFDAFAAPATSSREGGVQHLAVYHGVAEAGTPNPTPTAQRDALTVVSRKHPPRRLREPRAAPPRL
jgi:hypothetical protein